MVDPDDAAPHRTWEISPEAVERRRERCGLSGNTDDDGATTPTDAFVVDCHSNNNDCADPASWGEQTAETRVTDASFDSRKAPVARGFFLGDSRDSAPTETPSSHFSP